MVHHSCCLSEIALLQDYLILGKVFTRQKKDINNPRPRNNGRIVLDASLGPQSVRCESQEHGDLRSRGVKKIGPPRCTNWIYNTY